MRSRSFASSRRCPPSRETVPAPPPFCSQLVVLRKQLADARTALAAAKSEAARSNDLLRELEDEKRRLLAQADKQSRAVLALSRELDERGGASAAAGAAGAGGASARSSSGGGAAVAFPGGVLVAEATRRMEVGRG